MSTYTIPPGNQVSFPFAAGAPYTPPPGNRAAFRFGGAPGSIFAAGFDASAFGGAEVGNATAQVFPAGWDSGFVNGNVVLTKSLLVVGIAPGSPGTPRLVNLTQEIKPVGREALAAGSPWVSLGTRRLTGVTLGDQSRFGTLALAGGVRRVDVAGHSIAPAAPAKPVVSFRVREIFPTFIVATQWGRPLLDFQHDVNVPGFGGEAWGQPEVYRPRFIVDLQDLGIRGPLWGDNTTWLAKQYVSPPGWIGGGNTGPEQFGHSDVYNLKQVIAQQFEVTPSDGGVFGDFNSVANRNQQPRPEGFVMSRYGTPEVRNAARIVTMPPFIEFTAWGNNLVAPAIRTIEPVGSETSGWGSPLGTIVYNGARQLAPAGIAAGGMGKPNQVWSNLQALRVVGADASSFGEGMVAFAIRTVGPWSLPPPPPFGNAVVQLWERGVGTVGIAPGSFGGATLEQHFTIIAPKSTLPPANAFGEGRVQNRTPEVAIFGWTATAYGRTAVHNQFETYRFESFGGETFGHHAVKDRRIFLAVDGVAPLPISQRHQVRNVEPDPPAPQTILPVTVVAPGVPDPSVRTNVLAPTWASPDVRFGTAKLVSNGIMPQGITPPYSPDTGVQCGVPSFNGAQFLSVPGIAAPSSASPVADVGPRYVWAPMGYPYDTGYWREQGHQMDQAVFGADHPERPVFGRATITLLNRAIGARSPSAFLAFGTARFVQHPLYIRPNATNFQRFGFPTLNGGGDVDFYGFDMSSWGETSVQHAEDLRPRTLKIAGIAPGTSPRQDVQLLNRTIRVVGFYTFTVSPPAPPAWPRTSTWVSRAYPPFAFTGAEHAAYGTPWVSNYRRFVEPDGWLSDVVALDSPGSFRDRMKVRRQLRIDGASVGAGGGAGTGSVSLWLNRIAPAGLAASDVPRASARNVTRLNADGWLDSAFGDLQRWEAGKVKPHGDELVSFGRSVIRRAISPAGIAGAVGEPRLGSPLRPDGASHTGDGVPTLTAMWCGNRAIAAHEGPAGTAGIPTLEVVA